MKVIVTISHALPRTGSTQALDAGVAAYVIFRMPRDPRLEKGVFIGRPLMTFNGGTGPPTLFSAKEENLLSLVMCWLTYWRRRS